MLLKRKIKNIIVTTYDPAAKVEGVIKLENVSEKVRNPLAWAKKHAAEYNIKNEVVAATIERGVRTYSVPDGALDPYEVDDTTMEE